MLIVIPTYRRNTCLKWVLESLIQCTTDNIHEKIRVLVVNNYPPAQGEIKSIVDAYSHIKRFEWNILYREKSRPPVENWYSAIQENALPDEVVLLHGDDDIFCPWSIEDRYLAIQRLNADVLLTRAASRIIFLPDGETAILNGDSLPIKICNAREFEVQLTDSIINGAVFIGNNCYRYTDNWRKALTTSFEWCHKQSWLDLNSRTLMMPYYLPIAVNLLGGKLGALDSVCVIRGGDLQEIENSKFGSPGWNSGFLALCAYGVLSTYPLKEITALNPERNVLKNMAARWKIAICFDTRISSKIRKDTYNNIKIPFTLHFFLQSIMGIRIFLGDILKIRGWKYRWVSTLRPIKLQEFFHSLKGRS